MEKKRKLTKAEKKRIKDKGNIRISKLSKEDLKKLGDENEAVALKEAKRLAKHGISKTKKILNEAGDKARKNRPKNAPHKKKKLTDFATDKFQKAEKAAGRKKGHALDSAIREARPELEKRAVAADKEGGGFSMRGAENFVMNMDGKKIRRKSEENKIRAEHKAEDKAKKKKKEKDNTPSYVKNARKAKK